MKRLVFLLLLAPAVFAQHQYIIPIVGSAGGIDADHYAGASVLNPTRRTAHIRVTGVYPVYPLQCEPVVPAELGPRSRAAIAFHFDCPVRQLAALSIESDEPLVVKTTIVSHLRRFDVVIDDVQQIDAGTAWVPFAAEAVTHGVLDDDPGYRANLLLINPNAFALRVRIELNRPEAGDSRVDTIVVAPRSTVLHPLAPVPMPFSPFPRIITGHHDITISADDKFWAGVSSLTNTGGNRFEEAVPLEP